MGEECLAREEVIEDPSTNGPKDDDDPKANDYIFINNIVNLNEEVEKDFMKHDCDAIDKMKDDEIMHETTGNIYKNIKIPIVEENKKCIDYSLKFYSVNIRGLQSKLETFKNILVDNDIDVALVTETHCSRDKCIQIENYTCYYRNRSIKEKGGVSIYVHNRLANACMKLESGLDLNEFFVLKLECFNPNVIVVVYYGVIEQQYPNEVIAMQGDLFSIIRNYTSQGYHIVWGGDFNNHIGNNLGLTQNDEDVSEGGKHLIEFVKEENLELLNSRDGTHTHVDKKHGTSRILDMVITNNGSSVSKFEVDKNLKKTPYRLKKVKGGHRRVFTDHIGLTWQMEVKRTEETTNKRVMWNMNKRGGNEKYAMLTDEMAIDISTKVAVCDDVNEIYEFILQKIKKAKDMAYGKITKTKSQLKRMNEAQIWKRRTKEIERSIASLGRVKLTDKVWEMRSIVSDKFSDRQFVGVKNPETGSITQDREETYDVLLEYNRKLMNKDEVEKEGESIEEDKEEELSMKEAKKYILKEALEADTFEEDEKLEYEDYNGSVKRLGGIIKMCTLTLQSLVNPLGRLSLISIVNAMRLRRCRMHFMTQNY